MFCVFDHQRFDGRSSALFRRCIGVGPLLDSNLAEDDPKNKPIGSLVFFNAINDEEAKETAEGDPYNQAGLFDSVFIARCVCAFYVCIMYVRVFVDHFVQALNLIARVVVLVSVVSVPRVRERNRKQLLPVLLVWHGTHSCAEIAHNLPLQISGGSPERYAFFSPIMPPPLPMFRSAATHDHPRAGSLCLRRQV